MAREYDNEDIKSAFKFMRMYKDNNESLDELFKLWQTFTSNQLSKNDKEALNNISIYEIPLYDKNENEFDRLAILNDHSNSFNFEKAILKYTGCDPYYELVDGNMSYTHYRIISTCLNKIPWDNYKDDKNLKIFEQNTKDINIKFIYGALEDFDKYSIHDIVNEHHDYLEFISSSFDNPYFVLLIKGIEKTGNPNFVPVVDFLERRNFYRNRKNKINTIAQND